MTDSLSAYGAAFILYTNQPLYTRYTNGVFSTALWLHKVWISSFNMIDNPSATPPSLLKVT
ncbi:hypothetical protein BDW67DRAFT_152970 [Aspergillus spinulosporus]